MKTKSRYYFDHNATAVPQATISQGLLEILSEGPLNPSSVHTFGRLAKSRLETARRALATEIGARPEELRFTSGATEAIFDFIEGFLVPGDEVLVNPLEHPAVFGALSKVGVKIRSMEIDPCGRILLDKLRSQLTPQTKLVIVMKAQNELGNLYPVKEISALVAPIPLFCDTVQAFGKVPVDVSDLGVAGASFSAHKVGGLSGAGALWVRPDIELRPRTTGGSQERGERGGTENLIGIESFRLAIGGLRERVLAQGKLAGFRDLLLERLSPVVGFQCLGDPSHYLSNTLFFRVDGVPGDLIIQAMDLEGFALSTGSACSSGSVEPSRTLLALGCSVTEAKEGVRISMGPETTEESVELLAKILVDKLNEFFAKVWEHEVRVVVAMSGGVDSSVAAALMVEAGYEVIGITMKLRDTTPEEKHGSAASCCSPSDLRDARRVCDELGVPHYILDYREVFRTAVIEPFAQDYLNGLTPNPCVKCNDHVKFAPLMERAKQLGADYLVTGHYARVG